MPGTPGRLSLASPFESFEVGDLGGSQAVAGLDGGLVVGDGVGDAFDGDHGLDFAAPFEGAAVVHELQGVAVPGDDQDIVAEGFALLGEGAADIVGLVAVHFDDGDAEGAAGVAGGGALGLEVVGHGLAGAFVGFEFVVAERGDGGVKGREDEVGLFALQDGQQHEHEGVDGVGGHPVGVDRWRMAKKPR